jgi:DNA-binding PadR family transcriptional regulator
MSTRASSPSRNPGREPTELEACVLGVVAGQGPCTAYSVRSIFAASPTQRWSGSAGAIYPLVRRLRGRGLLAGTKSTQGARSATLYSLTENGAALLKRWLTTVAHEESVSIPVDPVRTRLHFLHVLEPPERLRWAETTLEDLEAQIAPLREEWATGAFSSDLHRLAARGVLDLAEARLAWFGTVHRYLCRDEVPPDDVPGT